MGLNKGYLTAKTNKASDEVYTPAYAIKPLLKYLDMYYHPEHTITIWCPFDKEDSEYVKIFRAEGYKVIATHIDNGQNFFYYEPSEFYHFIISNPPFSCKDDIIKRLYELNKPYAILLPDPNKKEIQKGISFGSFYLCRNFLYTDLIFEELEVN